MRIAVIGTGIGGLAAAWRLGGEADLTLFERLPALGMAAHGVEIGTGDEAVRADVPLRVVYPGYYPTLLSLYDEAGIDTVPVDYSSSFGEHEGATYFRYRNRRLGGRSVPFLWGRSALGARSLRIARDLVRFYAVAPSDLRKGRLADCTLGEYLSERRFSDDFCERFVLPAFAGIGTCSYDAVRAYPARVIVEYLTQGVLLEGVRRTVQGADFVVRRLASRAAEVRCNAAITRVERAAEGVVVEDREGRSERFDHVVIATQAHRALDFLRDAKPDERAAVQSFGYERSRVIVHSDARLAPPRRSDWSPVNFFVAKERDRPMATIWLNAVLPVPDGTPDVFQTWNPLREPDPASVLAEAEFDRPVVDRGSLNGLARIDALHEQPGRRVWFCGSYARDGVPLLESAAASASRVARRILEARGA